VGSTPERLTVKLLLTKCSLLIAAVSALVLLGAGPAVAAPPVAGTTSPPAPIPLTPAAGGMVTVPLTLSWSAVSDSAGVADYNWQVSRSPSMTPIVDQGSVTAPQTSAVVSGLPVGTYYWQVQAFDNDFNLGPFSSSRTFVVTGANSGEPAAPVLGPAENGATSFHPFFLFTMSWQAVPGATSYAFEFDLTNNGFDPVHTTTSILPCVSNLAVLGFPSPPPPPPGTCETLTGNFGQPNNVFFRVQAINASGARSVPSNVDKVAISFTAPLSAPPDPIGPAASAPVTFPFQVSFTNVAIPQLQSYEVQFSTSPSFNKIEFDVPFIDPDVPFVDRPGSSSSLTVQQGLNGGKTYWRVRATEGDNSPDTAAVTAWSKTASFTMSSAPPVVVSLSSDATSLPNGIDGVALLQLSADVGSGGAVVRLHSSDPDALPVPASVDIDPLTQTTPFIGAGEATAQIQWQAGNVTKATPVTVTATLGSSTASVTIIVEPTELQGLELDPSTFPGGQAASATLQFTGLTPPDGAVISVSASSASVQVPPTVTVPAGAQSAFFALTTSTVTAATTVTVTATYLGHSVTSQLTLTPQ
jgi:hypothetical protein